MSITHCTLTITGGEGAMASISNVSRSKVVAGALYFEKDSRGKIEPAKRRYIQKKDVRAAGPDEQLGREGRLPTCAY